MKKLFTVLCFTAGSAFASDPQHLDAHSYHHFYVGVQAGYANSTFKQNDVEPYFQASKLDHTGLEGRLNVGYLLTPHFALEAGGMLLPPIKWSTTEKDIRGENRYLIDAFGKVILPFQNDLSVFGKVGLAWYHQDKKYEDTHSPDSGVIPAIGIGSNYRISPQLSIDLNYTYYLKKGKKENISDVDLSGHYFAATHFISVGLGYIFG